MTHFRNSRFLRLTLTALIAPFATADLTAQLIPLRFNGTQNNGEFGTTVAIAPDLDSDGLPELMVGAPRDATTTDNTGSVQIFSSSSRRRLVDVRGNRRNRRIGTVLAVVRDLDGDGVEDFVTGNPADSERGTNAGYVAAYSMRTGRMLWEQWGLAHTRMGFAISSMADFDRDGIDDVAVGMPGSTSPSVFDRVGFLSGRTGRLMLAIVTVNGQYERFGSSIARFPDANNDGRDELVIGAPGAGGNGGTVYLVSTVARNPIGTARFSNSSFSNMGRSLAVMPDLNGNRFPEVLIGGFNVAQVFDFRRFGALATHRDGRGSLRFFGERVAVGGDFNGDGSGNYAIAAPGDTTRGTSAGAVYIYSNATHRLVHTAYGATRDFMGLGLAATPDLNSDGLTEWLIGSPTHVAGGFPLGRAFTYALSVASSVARVRPGCGTDLSVLAGSITQIRPGGFAPFRLQFAQAGPGLLLVGGPANVDLGPLGMPGCNLQVGIAVQVPFFVRAPTLPTQINMQIPRLVSVFRARFQAQAVTTAPGVNTLGLHASNGLSVFIGNN